MTARTTWTGTVVDQRTGAIGPKLERVVSVSLLCSTDAGAAIRTFVIAAQHWPQNLTNGAHITVNVETATTTRGATFYRASAGVTEDGTR